jgi:hypothetical protein
LRVQLPVAPVVFADRTHARGAAASAPVRCVDVPRVVSCAAPGDTPGRDYSQVSRQ